jgi:hypothetical protein
MSPQTKKNNKYAFPPVIKYFLFQVKNKSHTTAISVRLFLCWCGRDQFFMMTFGKGDKEDVIIFT